MTESQIVTLFAGKHPSDFNEILATTNKYPVCWTREGDKWVNERGRAEKSMLKILKDADSAILA